MSRSRRGSKRKNPFIATDSLTPMNSAGNVFDVAMVFSVALLVALVMFVGVPELLTNEEVTFVKNPGKDNMQIIHKMEDTIKIMEISEAEEISGGIGEVLGTAYKLEDGSVIYVPEDTDITSHDPDETG